MKRSLTLLLVALICVPLASADVLTHKRELAGKILKAYGAKDAFRAHFAAEIEPQLKNLAKNGAPQDEVNDVRQAMLQWFDADIKWSEIKPELEDLYAREFSEPELEDILAFAKTESGKKFIQKLTDLMIQGAKIGSRYATARQGSLNARIREIRSRYKNTPGKQDSAKGGGTSGE